jgi:rubrerythrin
MKISGKGDNIIISDFNEAEALQLAMKLERDGIKYYSELSAKTKDPEVKKVFARLIAEEEKHFVRFKGLLEGLGVEADPGYEEQPLDFIDSGVFGDIMNTEKTLSKIKSDLDAVSLGEWAELNSINFYKAIHNNSNNDLGKKALKDIIRQEQEHLKAFVRYKDMLEKSKKC